MSRGDRPPNHIVSLRRKKVASLALQGLKPGPIARQLGMSDKIRTIFRDLRDLDLAAAADIESVELRKKLRTNRIAALKELEKVVAESDQLNDADRIQATLAITDRYIKLGMLDDASLVGGGKPEDAPVTVVLNVEFE